MVGHIVKKVMTVGWQVNTGIGAELRIDGPGTAIERGVEIGKIDSLIHQPHQSGGILLRDHPVIHGLHQHQHHILAFQNAGHGIVLRFAPLCKECINGLLVLVLLHPVTGGQGEQFMLPEIPECQLVNTADIIHAAGIVHGLISCFIGRRPGIFRPGTPNILVPPEHDLRQSKQHRHGNCCNGGAGNP